MTVLRKCSRSLLLLGLEGDGVGNEQSRPCSQCSEVSKSEFSGVEPTLSTKQIVLLTAVAQIVKLEGCGDQRGS